MAADLTVTVAADVSLRALQEKLAGHGQWVPADGDESWSVGRLVSENSSGPLRLGFGAWRDLLLGVQFRNGRGELVTAGGKTVKNVAGYDLTKFMVGQRGVFGSLVTLTMRTYKRPAAAGFVRFADGKLAAELVASPMRPQWMMLNAGGLDVGYLGDDVAVDFCLERIAGKGPTGVVRRTAAEDTEHRARAWRMTGEGRFRASVPPAKVVEFVGEAGCEEWSADAAFGTVLGTSADVERVTRAARSVGGSAYYLDRPAASAGYSDVEKRVLEKLKRAFDPEGRLAPLEFA